MEFKAVFQRQPLLLFQWRSVLQQHQLIHSHSWIQEYRNGVACDPRSGPET
jgi:hypothetical protein